MPFWVGGRGGCGADTEEECGLFYEGGGGGGVRKKEILITDVGCVVL